MRRDRFNEKTLKALNMIINNLICTSKQDHGSLYGIIEEILGKSGVVADDVIRALVELIDLLQLQYQPFNKTIDYHSFEYLKQPKYLLIAIDEYEKNLGLIELSGAQHGERSKLVVYDGEVVWDKIVASEELSGLGVSISSPQIVYGRLASPLVSLIISGRTIAWLRNIALLYIELGNLILANINSLEASMALIESIVMPNAVISIKPSHIEKDVLRKIIASAIPSRYMGWVMGNETVFDTFLEVYETYNKYIEIANKATGLISSFYRNLRFGWLELSATYIGKASITVPKNALINMLWRCRPGQSIMIGSEEIRCGPNPSLAEKLLRFPQGEPADSVVFIKIEFADGDEIVIDRR